MGEHRCSQYVKKFQAISGIKLTLDSILIQSGENDYLKFKKNTLRGPKMHCRYDSMLLGLFEGI